MNEQNLVNDADCEYSAAVTSATKSGQWPEPLRSHTATCARCRETMAMTTLMDESAARELPHPLPHFRTLWLKARYARKQERFTKFDLFGLAGVTFSGCAGLVVMLMVIFPHTFGTIIHIPDVSVSQLTNMFPGGTKIFLPAVIAVLVWIFTRDSLFAGN